MEQDEFEEDRAAFIAGEIGNAVLELVMDRRVICRDSIIERLEEKRHTVGNVIHKGILREAVDLIRRGY